MATIIPFPVKKSRKELEGELENLIIDVSLDLTVGVFSRLESTFPQESIDIMKDENMQKSMILIHEAIKAAVSRAYNKEHFLHGFAEEFIKFEGADIKFEIDGEEP